ncbi:MAG: glucose 1-dehydrogenase [Planctomycetota bacterium]
MMKRLNGQVVLITGGANGIGAAAAIIFADEGARVAIVDIDEKSAQSLVSQAENKGQDVYFIRNDVSKACDVMDSVSKVEKKYGRIDVLYNNASVYLPSDDGAITDIDEDIWDRVISTNLKSVYMFCKYTIPLMIKAGGGSIINTASSAGVTGIPNCDAYTATKGATIALTRSMAVEFGPENIRVNCIAPAAIATPMLSQSSLDSPVFDEKRFLGLRTPLRRYGTAEEVAKLALFLASNESSYINGAIITADGGVTINGDLAKLPGE